MYIGSRLFVVHFTPIDFQFFFFSTLHIVLGKMNLNEINETGVAATKPLIKVKELVEGTAYPIVKAKIVNTKFGESVLLELEEASCFLPKRATEAFKSQIDKFVVRKYGLVFKGVSLNKTGKYLDITKFEIVDL